MNGICAINKSQRGLVEPRELGTMLAALAGAPSSRTTRVVRERAGYAILDRGRVGLGHGGGSELGSDRRGQPFTLPSNVGSRITVAFTGALTGADAIEDDLIARGRELASRADAELVAHLFAEYGLGALDHLQGEFAFVLWDERSGRLVAACDQAGAVSLHYCFAAGDIRVASEAKALFASGDVPRGLSHAYVVSSAFSGMPSEGCAFRDVRRMPAGHVLIAEKGNIVLRSYADDVADIDNSMTFEDAKAGIYDGVVRAVRRRLDGAKSVALVGNARLEDAITCSVLSSEGRDVTACAITFADHADKSLRDATSDRMARHYDAKVHAVNLSSEELADGFAESVISSESVRGDTSGVVHHLLGKTMAAQGYRQVFSADGADELFAGHAYFATERLRETARSGGRSIGARWSSRDLALWSDAYRSADLLFGAPPWGSLETSYFDWRSSEQRRLLSKLLAFDIPSNDGRAALRPKSGRSTSGSNDSVGFRELRALASCELRAVTLPTGPSAVSRATGRVVRLPFLDRDLTSFVATIPTNHLVDLTTLREKSALFAAFAFGLPDFVRDAPEPGPVFPSFRALLQSASGRALEDQFLSDRAVKTAGLFRRGSVAAAKVLWRTLPARSSAFKRVDSMIGRILAVHVLHHAFGEPVQRAPLSPASTFELVDRTPRSSSSERRAEAS